MTCEWGVGSCDRSCVSEQLGGLPFLCGTFKSNNNINNKKTFVNPKSDQQLVSRYSYAEAFTKIVGIILKKKVANLRSLSDC